MAHLHPIALETPNVAPSAILAHVHLSVVLGVVALGLVYVVTAARMKRLVQRRQAAAFVGALITILLALGPVDALADQRLFTAHMAQHLLLALVMPPLLLLGTPAWMLRPLLQRRPILRLARLVTLPIVAFTVYNGFLAAIHTTPIYERMVRDEGFHIAIHVSLMITGTIMWWPLLSPLPELPRLAYPAQTLYLFLLLIPMAAISAPITLAGHVIYPWYLEGPHPWGIPPLTDQVVGGLLMWVGSGVYLMAVFSLMFFRWAQREDRDEPLVGRPLAAPSPTRVS
jgi:putative membrane protein